MALPRAYGVRVHRNPGRVESMWTSVDGLLLHARVTVDPLPADAPAVVLVHGVGVSSRYMAPTAAWLAPDFRVYAPDLPGFGKSAKPARPLALSELTDWLAGWMRAIGLERAALVGNSVGCQIVVDLAVRHPERVERAVLQGPTVDPEARTIRQQLWRWLANTPGEARSEGLVIMRDYADCGVRRFVRTFRDCLRDRVEEKLRAVRVPTLVVRGSRDRIVPQRWAAEAARLLPMGRLVVVPGGPHTLNYSAPLELVRVIRPFLLEDRQSPGDAARGQAR